MRGSAHAGWALLFGGAYVGVSGYWIADPFGAVACVALFTLSAVLPDIDHPDADVASGMGPFTRAGAWAIRKSHHHRGFTHTVWAAAAVGLLIGLHPSVRAHSFAVSCAAGWLLHVLQDATTPSGVAWLWPLTSRRLHLGPGFARHPGTLRRRRPHR